MYTLNIGIQQKAMLALMLLGKKPAVELDIFENNSSPDKVLNVLSSIGLCVYATHLPQDRNPNHITTYCVSVSDVNATLLVSVVEIRNRTKEKNTSLLDVTYGALMGYPLSAIEGYITHQTLPDDHYPGILQDDLLVMFKLSKANFIEEMEVILKWRYALDENADYILKDLDNVIVK